MTFQKAKDGIGPDSTVRKQVRRGFLVGIKVRQRKAFVSDIHVVVSIQGT